MYWHFRNYDNRKAKQATPCLFSFPLEISFYGLCIKFSQLISIRSGWTDRMQNILQPIMPMNAPCECMSILSIEIIFRRIHECKWSYVTCFDAKYPLDLSSLHRSWAVKMQHTSCTEDRIQHALDRCLDGLRQSPTAAHHWNGKTAVVIRTTAEIWLSGQVAVKRVTTK